MNEVVLKEAEARFLALYPGGFDDPKMSAMAQRHKVLQLSVWSKEVFAEDRFGDVPNIVSDMVKLVNRSSMVSPFEKPKFRAMVKSLGKTDRELLAEALYDLLYDNERSGFEQLVYELQKRKLARWVLVTLFQTYVRPRKDVLVKPTSTKLIIEKLDLGLIYSPVPTWDFYKKYRKCIISIRGKVAKSLSPHNPALCGFLMMSLDEHIDG